MVIREMWAGKVVAAAMKDVTMVQYAIQNTLLIDAVIARYVKLISLNVFYYLKGKLLIEEVSTIHSL